MTTSAPTTTTVFTPYHTDNIYERLLHLSSSGLPKIDLIQKFLADHLGVSRDEIHDTKNLQCPLTIACQTGRIDVLATLLLHPLLIQTVNCTHHRDMKTPLHVACDKNSPGMVDTLISTGNADFVAEESLGFTPLGSALVGNKIQVMQYWMARGLPAYLGKAGDRLHEAREFSPVRYGFDDFWVYAHHRQGDWNYARAHQRFGVIQRARERCQFSHVTIEAALDWFTILLDIQLREGPQGDARPGSAASRLVMPLEEADLDPETRRFLRIALALPEDLQQMLCRRMAGSMLEVISETAVHNRYFGARTLIPPSTPQPKPTGKKTTHVVSAAKPPAKDKPVSMMWRLMERLKGL